MGERSNPHKDKFLLALFFCLLYLPFIDKAFHIDDVNLIKLSEMIGWNPLRAVPVDFHFYGKVFEGFLPYELSNHLLILYFIKAVRATAGEAEVVLHVLFMVFPVTAILSIIKLNSALFSSSRGILPAVFLCSLPAYLVNSHNIMADVPTLSLLLLSITIYILSIEKSSKGLPYLAGAILCLSTLASFQVLVFVPLVFVYALMKRRLGIHTVISLSMPVILLFFLLLAMYQLYGIFPVLKDSLDPAQASITSQIKAEISRGLSPRVLAGKVINILATIGSSAFFMVPAYYFLKNSAGRFFLYCLSLTVLSYLVVFRFTAYGFYENSLLSLLISLGVLSLAAVFKSFLKNMDGERHSARETFLFLWTISVIGYNIFFLPFGAARYLLPALPPVMLVLLNGADWKFKGIRNRVVVSCAVSLSVLFGFANARADYEYANTYRDCASEIKVFRAGLDNSDIWYIGEWGMAYYMHRAGARYLLADSNEPRKGDFIIVPEMPRLWAPSLALQKRLRLYADKRYASGFPLRLFNINSRAGFYSHYWGLLPFSFSTKPDELFHIYEVI